jgi:hypothetical protein
MDGTVVVGLDDSGCGRAALRYGIQEARALGVTLELVRAAVPAGHAGGLVRHAKPDPGGRVLIAGYTEVRRSAPGLPIIATFADGPAVDTLVQRSIGAEVVVLGAHRATGSGAGATSGGVALRGEGPIVVVPAVSPAGGPVVVGVDESGESRDALAYAFRTARRYGTGVLAIHAWQPDPVRRELYVEQQTYGQWVLDTALRPWRRTFPDVTVEARPLPGAIAVTLHAAAVRARLLVIGAGSGTVARQVLDRLACPVAVVHPGRTPLVLDAGERFIRRPHRAGVPA